MYTSISCASRFQEKDFDFVKKWMRTRIQRMLMKAMRKG
jgi:hypothetical protein